MKIAVPSALVQTIEGRDVSAQHILFVYNDSEQLEERFGAKRTYTEGKRMLVHNNYNC